MSSSVKCGNGLHHLVSPSKQILYIVSAGSVTTYSIDRNSLAATPIEQTLTLVPTSFLQFDPAPDDHYVYVVWSDVKSVRHLSVFQTDSAGVPQVPAIQMLNADSLSQFNMHPSGRFAYMLQVTTTTTAGYDANIRRFNVQRMKGILKENSQAQGSYGPAPYWPAFLYGFNENGTKLYDMSPVNTGSLYRQRPVNLTTGMLGDDIELLSVNGEAEVAIGDVIVAQYQNDVDPNQNYLDIFPNVPSPSHPLIHCTVAMARACATATNVQLDESGHFLFLTDPATQAIRVAKINSAAGRIVDTGNTIPMTSQTSGLPSVRMETSFTRWRKTEACTFITLIRPPVLSAKGGTPLVIPNGWRHLPSSTSVRMDERQPI